MTSRHLKDLITALRTNIQAMRLQFSIKLDRDELFTLVDYLQKSTKAGHACYIPIWKLSEWLSKYVALRLSPKGRFGTLLRLTKKLIAEFG
jgi:hypothetical protein